MGTAPSEAKIRLAEGVLRRKTIHVVLPSFPPEALRRRAQGVAVAELEVNEEGYVAHSRVLQAPDPAIRAAVEEAIKQWTFRPTTVRKTPVRVVGKLTFYFVIEGGKGRVLNPEEMRRQE